MGKASRRKKENRSAFPKGDSTVGRGEGLDGYEIVMEIERAIALKRGGQLEAAYRVYEQLNQKYPNTASIIYSWAKTVAALGRYEDAIALYENARGLYEGFQPEAAWQCEEHIKSLREAGGSSEFKNYMCAVSGNRNWIYRTPSSNPGEFVAGIDRQLKSLAAPDFHSDGSLWVRYFREKLSGGTYFGAGLSSKIQRYDRPFVAEEIATPLTVSGGMDDDRLNVLPLESGYLAMLDSADGIRIRRDEVPVLHLCHLRKEGGAFVASKVIEMISPRPLEFWQWAHFQRNCGKETIIVSGYDPAEDCIVWHNVASGEEGRSREFVVNRRIHDLRNAHESREIAIQTHPHEHPIYVGEHGDVGVLFFRRDRRYVAVDLKSKMVRWQEEVEEYFYSVIYRGMLISVREEYVEARNVKTGKIVVKGELNDENSWCYVDPVVFGGNLYLSTDDGMLWEVDIPNPIESNDLSSNLDYKLAIEGEKMNRDRDPGHFDKSFNKNFGSLHKKVAKANRDSGFRCEDVLQFVHDGSFYRCRPVVLDDAMFIYVPVQDVKRRTSLHAAHKLCIVKLRADHTASAVRWLMMRLQMSPFATIASYMGGAGDTRAIETFERSLSRSLFRCKDYYNDMKQKAFIDVYCLSSREKQQFSDLDPRVRFVSVEAAYRQIYANLSTTLTYQGGCPDFESLFFCDRSRLPDLVRVDFQRSKPAFSSESLSERGKYLWKEVFDSGGFQQLEISDRAGYQSALEKILNLPSEDRACILEHEYFQSRHLDRNLTRETGMALFQAGEAGRAIYYLFMSNCLLESEFDFDTSAMMPLMQALCQVMYFGDGDVKASLLKKVDKDYKFEVDGLPQDFEFFFGLPLGGERLMRRFEVINRFVSEQKTAEANELVPQAMVELEEYLSQHENERLQVGTLLELYDVTIPRLIGLNIDTGNVAEALRIFESFKAMILRRYLSNDNRKVLLDRLHDEPFYQELRQKKAKFVTANAGERLAVPLYSTQDESPLDQRYSLRAVNTGIGAIDVAGILGAMSSDAILLEYYLEEGRQGVFIARSGCDLRYVQLSTDSLDRYLDEVEGFSEAIWSSRKDAGRIGAHLKGMYNKLIKPIEGYLEGCNHLIVVPTKFLFHCPFTALFDGTSYLVERFRVSISPSASIHAICSGNQSSRIDFLTLVKGDDEELLGIVREESFLRERFGRKFEVVASYPPPNEVLSRTDVFHFAGHGTFDELEPLLSRIQVGKEDSISVLDLYGLDMSNVRLAVVNACLSGMTKVEAVDDIFGLVRGFFTAGCPTVINTLWNLPDRVAPVFAESFYSELEAAADPLASFTHSIRNLIRSEAFCDPQHWACYQYYGKGGSDFALAGREPKNDNRVSVGCALEWLRGVFS